MDYVNSKSGWIFESRRKKDHKANPGGVKHFQDNELLTYLVRESVQNSLDAKSELNTKEFVRIRFNCTSLSFIDGRKLKLLLDFKTLKKHLKASNIPVKKLETICLLTIEDFGTTGLTGKNEADFLDGENYTNKETGGGSHGVGKAIFYDASKINTLMVYSITDENKTILRGGAALEIHKIGDKRYRPWGKIDLSSSQSTLKSFCQRHDEHGLSIFIPFFRLSEDIVTIRNKLENNILKECYKPIIADKLVIEIADKTLDRTSIQQESSDQIQLQSEIQNKNYETIRHQISKENSFNLDNLLEEIKNTKNNNLSASIKESAICFEINIKNPDPLRKNSYGKVKCFIREYSNSKNKSNNKPDFWRGDILIQKATSLTLPKNFTSIVLIEEMDRGQDNFVYSVLRKVENPSHTKWETQNISDKIIDQLNLDQSTIKKIVSLVKKLPNNLVQAIQETEFQELDEFSLSKYFPASTQKTNNQTSQSNYDNEQQNNTFDNKKITSLDSAVYIPREFNCEFLDRGDGFILKLNKHGRGENRPKTIKITTAYGTISGSTQSAIDNYDTDDFRFNEDIKITPIGHVPASIQSGLNSVKYEILNDDFTVRFENFDIDRELKIQIELELEL